MKSLLPAFWLAIVPFAARADVNSFPPRRDVVQISPKPKRVHAKPQMATVKIEFVKPRTLHAWMHTLSWEWDDGFIERQQERLFELGLPRVGHEIPPVAVPTGNLEEWSAHFHSRKSPFHVSDLGDWNLNNDEAYEVFFQELRVCQAVQQNGTPEQKREALAVAAADMEQAFFTLHDGDMARFIAEGFVLPLVEFGSLNRDAANSAAGALFEARTVVAAQDEEHHARILFDLSIEMSDALFDAPGQNKNGNLSRLLYADYLHERGDSTSELTYLRGIAPDGNLSVSAQAEMMRLQSQPSFIQ